MHTPLFNAKSAVRAIAAIATVAALSGEAGAVEANPAATTPQQDNTQRTGAIIITALGTGLALAGWSASKRPR